LDSRHAGKLSLLVHGVPAAADSSADSEHLVLQLRAKGASSSSSSNNSTITPASAAASTLAVLQQVNAAQQVVAAACTGQQLAVHAALSLASTTLGPGLGLQDTAGRPDTADAASAVWGLLRTEATEQTAVKVSLQAVDEGAAQQSASSSADGAFSPGFLQAAAVSGQLLQVPRLLPCSKPEGAEFIVLRPEPRSSLSNLVARAADISQVWGQTTGPGLLCL
jgi:hypothetical protein